MSTPEQDLPLPEQSGDPKALPVSAPPREERLTSLDLIRGVAILGILPANLAIFAGPISGAGNRPAFGSPLDHAVAAVILLLVDVKFVTTLSILFGAGLGLQLQRAQARGDRRFPWYYLWRQALLLGIGVCHALFIWFGDILGPYAFIGAIALGVALIGRGMVKGVAIFGLAWNYAIWLLFLVVVLLVGNPFDQPTPAGRPVSPDGPPVSIFFGDGPLLERIQGYVAPENQIAIYRHGHFGHLIENRAIFYSLQLIGLPFWIGWYILACFLIGVLLIRTGLFHDSHRREAGLDAPGKEPPLAGQEASPAVLAEAPKQVRPAPSERVLEAPPRPPLAADQDISEGAAIDYHAGRQRVARWFVILGLAIGLPLHLAAAVLYLINPKGGLPTILNQLGALPQALLYLVVFVAWSQSGFLPWLQASLRAVGRMALTNYLMQSIICTTIFYGYGLGLYGQTGLAGAVPVMVGIWVLELLWSPLWLRYFSAGPVEWLWRKLAGRRPFAAPGAA
jgi:uncharacterized membrane protein YeiB